jgi:hypothetical protein
MGFFENKNRFVDYISVRVFVGMSFGAAVIYARMHGIRPKQVACGSDRLAPATVHAVHVPYLRQIITRQNACDTVW